MKEMIFTKKTVLFSVVLLLTLSCGRLEDLNRNIKDFNYVTPDALANSATKDLIDQIFIQDVNNNNFRLWVEHWTETTYTDEANYNVVTRKIPKRVFSEIYGSLQRYKDAIELLDKEEIELVEDDKRPQLINKKSVLETLTVLAYTHLVECFGDIPYAESLRVDEKLTPVYDNAKEVYKALISRLKEAIESMDTGSDGPDTDNIYNGDMKLWKKFAASLYLRMGMVIADSDPRLSKTTVEDAVSKGVFESNKDNAMYRYVKTPPNRNPVYNTITASGRYDYVAANTLVNKLNSLNDPRRPHFFTTVKDDHGNEIYKGGIVGLNNTYGKFSHISDEVGAVSDRPARVMDYSEVAFLLAEAVERGYSVGGDARTYYEKGIRASLSFWGVSGDDADDYLSQRDIQYDSIDYKASIGTQMWIAMYNRGTAAWIHWRRYDKPDLTGATAPKTNPKTADAMPPRRLTYPIEEQTINGKNLESAASNIGGDTLETKLFWDKN